MYFAEIDLVGTVLRVIVADQAFIDTGTVGDKRRWKFVRSDNYTGKGYTFDGIRNRFDRPPIPVITKTEAELFGRHT